MLIEVGAPACLPLGLVRIDDEGAEKTCWLGLTVQHPPVHLFAQTGQDLNITGARADVGYRQAQRFLAYHRRPAQAQIEIELSVPAFVGLGSEAILGLSIGAALAQLHNLSEDRRQPAALARAVGLDAGHLLETHSFARGGLLLVNSAPGENNPSPVQRRAEIAHPEHKAWAWVFFFPRLPAATPKTLEADRLQTVLQAAPFLNSKQGSVIIDSLWQAIRQDDIDDFGQTLLTLQSQNQTALAQAGAWLPPEPEHQKVLDIMREYGALAWGQSLFGYCTYGLVEGAKASIDLRARLRQHLDPFAGQVMATITANSGARQAEQPGDLNLNKYRPIG